MKVAQSCLTLCDPMDYTVHGILQDRVLEWVAFPFSRESSQPMDWTQSPTLQVDSLPAEPPGKPNWFSLNPSSLGTTQLPGGWASASQVILKPFGIISGELRRAPIHSSLCLDREKNSTRDKGIDKMWFIKIGCLWGLQVGRREMPRLENLLGYSFIIKWKVGRGRRPSISFLSRCHASIMSSSSRYGRGVLLSLHSQARSTNSCFLCVQRACSRVINLLSSLDKMWVSCHHCVIVWGQVSCFCYMVLLLSNPAWSCG